jgi:hypothetical protein
MFRAAQFANTISLAKALPLHTKHRTPDCIWEEFLGRLLNTHQKILGRDQFSNESDPPNIMEKRIRIKIKVKILADQLIFKLFSSFQYHRRFF